LPSVTVYWPWASPVKVAVPLPLGEPVVLIVADMVTPGAGPPVSVKVNRPLPPLVFLVITTEPRALLTNAGVQGVEPAPLTTAVQLEVTGTKSGLLPSVTVYWPCASPVKVAVPLPLGEPVVLIVADMVTPGAGPPVRVKVNRPLPPLVVLALTAATTA